MSIPTMSISAHSAVSLLMNLKSYPSGFKEGHPWGSIADGGRTAVHPYWLGPVGFPARRHRTQDEAITLFRKLVARARW
ncbi:hypothetical protein FIBSPDRAFT_69508 [Athelia psychrophila]|uniref:Uncharacterized protein n=1 Tax=Athelia psychrophila TaxID=1759441 RepID=A0A166TSD0_9AGAM|nr:hypothetical protein FIBSPDRAFT_69508 [Fibularhizoctonia sp. CBS 109695]